MKKPESAESASALIDKRIKELGDWRGKTLANLRQIIHEAEPEIVEEWKWKGTPVWSRSGIVCTGETYKAVVKMTFAKGAALQDPSGLFNSSLDGNVRRAIDIHEGGKIDEAALKNLICAAVALNLLKKPRKTIAENPRPNTTPQTGCALGAPGKEQRISSLSPGGASASFAPEGNSKPKPRRAGSKRAD